MSFPDLFLPRLFEANNVWKGCKWLPAFHFMVFVARRGHIHKFIGNINGLDHMPMLVADGFCRKHLFFKLIKLLEIVVAYNHLDTMRKLPIKHLNELFWLYSNIPLPHITNGSWYPMVQKKETKSALKS